MPFVMRLCPLSQSCISSRVETLKARVHPTGTFYSDALSYLKFVSNASPKLIHDTKYYIKQDTELKSVKSIAQIIWYWQKKRSKKNNLLKTILNIQFPVIADFDVLSFLNMSVYI